MTKNLLLVLIVIMSTWTVAYCSDLSMATQPMKVHSLALAGRWNPGSGELSKDPALVIKYNQF